MFNFMIQLCNDVKSLHNRMNNKEMRRMFQVSLYRNLLALTRRHGYILDWKTQVRVNRPWPRFEPSVSDTSTRT